MQTKNGSYIDIQNMFYEYTNLNGGLPVLKNVNISINKGAFVSIIGPSGCGKTTLLRLIAGLIMPTEGRISIDNLPPLDAIKRRMVGYVFQRPVLFEWRNVRQNIELPGEIFKRKSVIKKTGEYLKLVGLNDEGDLYPHELSGGMQSRVAIARALVSEPEILLLDEPFADLDELNRERLNLELLRIWAEIKTTMVFVTHNVEEAVFLSDEVYILSANPGKIFEVVSIDLKRPRNIELYNSTQYLEYVREIRKIMRLADCRE